VPRTWADAPAPARVAKKAAELAGRQGDRVRGRRARAFGLRPLTGAAGFGAALWGASYAELVPLGIYEPPWRVGVAAADAVLDR